MQTRSTEESNQGCDFENMKLFRLEVFFDVKTMLRNIYIYKCMYVCSDKNGVCASVRNQLTFLSPFMLLEMT